MNAREIIVALKGRWHGQYGSARCPAHDDQNPSLIIKDNPEGGIIVKCFAGCDWRDVKAELRRMGLLPGFAGAGAVPSETGEQRQSRQEVEQRERIEKIAWAQSIWSESKSALGTPVEAYLKGRGINLLPSTIRCHGALKHIDSGCYFPAMVAAVTQWPSRDLIGLHRTFIASDGSGKANVEPNKMLVGRCAGGAVRLASAGKTLAVCEGIETGLSVQQATGIHTWAALSASGIEALVLPDPPLVREVIIAADHDESGRGLQAAEKAAVYWSLEGRQVRISHPKTPRSDFNDLLMEDLRHGQG